MVSQLLLPKELQEIPPKLLGNALINLIKQDISNRYKETREVTDEDWEFCEQIDWHPVDELEYKEEFVKRVLDSEKQPSKTATKLDFWKE